MMLRKLRPRLTYANVVASLALFLAVGGGTAFAVVAANQVNSASIVDGQVKNPDLAPDSVGTGKISDGQVKNPDLAPDSVGTGKISDAQVKSSDVGPDAIDSSKVAFRSLTGDDVALGSLTGDNVKTRSLGVYDYVPAYGFSGRINGLAPSGVQYAAVSGASTASTDAGHTQMAPNTFSAYVGEVDVAVHLKHAVASGSVRFFYLHALHNGVVTDFFLCSVVAGTDCHGTEHIYAKTLDAHTPWQIKTGTKNAPGATTAIIGLRIRETATNG
jgi:hypothetical protein